MWQNTVLWEVWPFQPSKHDFDKFNLSVTFLWLKCSFYGFHYSTVVDVLCTEWQAVWFVVCMKLFYVIGLKVCLFKYAGFCKSHWHWRQYVKHQVSSDVSPCIWYILMGYRSIYIGLQHCFSHSWDTRIEVFMVVKIIITYCVMCRRPLICQTYHLGMDVTVPWVRVFLNQ